MANWGCRWRSRLTWQRRSTRSTWVPWGNRGLGLEDHPHQSIDEWQPRAELQRSKKRCFWAERRIKQIMEGLAPNDRSELCPLWIAAPVSPADAAICLNAQDYVRTSERLRKLQTVDSFLPCPLKLAHVNFSSAKVADLLGQAYGLARGVCFYTP